MLVDQGRTSSCQAHRCQRSHLLTSTSQGPMTLNPLSQSFSQSYGSILPTSLTYIVLSTRGCTPWRPAAVMSTTSHKGKTFPWIFTDRQRRTRHTKSWCALPKGKPLRQLSWFRGDQSLTRKENSSRSLCRRLQVHLRYRLPCDLFRNINRIPFRGAASQRRTFTELTSLLGSTNPGPTAVHLEPFPTSVFKVLIWIFATTTKICTRGCFTRPHGLRCFTTPTPSYSSWRPACHDGRVWVTRLSAIHFQGYFIRQVSHNTLLSGCRLSWPPPCCLDELTPFMGSNERVLRHLNSTFGSSRIASSAYQKWPTKHSHSWSGSIKQPRSSYPFKVWE